MAEARRWSGWALAAVAAVVILVGLLPGNAAPDTDAMASAARPRRKGLEGRIIGERYEVTRTVAAGANTLIAAAVDTELDAAGRSLGTLPAPPGQAVPSGPAAPAPAGPAVAPVDLTGVSVRDFDPAGDGQERPGSVANAHDGDPSTAWETERYDSAAFDRLGTPTEASRVLTAHSDVRCS